MLPFLKKYVKIHKIDITTTTTSLQSAEWQQWQ